MPRSISTFLMFDGRAEEAVTAYVALFADSAIRSLERWGEREPGREGTIKALTFTLAGHAMRAFDSPGQHAFGFTPAMSLFVECASEAELDAAWVWITDGGKVLMPVNNYGFSTKFGWADDRFGVSWQLTWA